MTEDNLWAYHSWVEGVWHPDNLSFLKWGIVFFGFSGGGMFRLALSDYPRYTPVEWTMIVICTIGFILSTKFIARWCQGCQLIGFLIGVWAIGEYLLLVATAVAVGGDFSPIWAWSVIAGSVLVAVAAADYSRRKILNGRMRDPEKSGSNRVVSGKLRPWGPGIIGLIVAAPALARTIGHSNISTFFKVLLGVFCSLFFIAGAGFHVWGVYAKFKYPSFTVKMTSHKDDDDSTDSKR